MPTLRVRKPFVATFAALLLGAAYLGLSTQKIPQYGQSDKGLHFLTFFLLTLTFYWILDTSRRRTIHLTLLVCTAALAIGSEVVQALLPNGRSFDPFDILANVVGSALALLLCSWYHKRMLERRRKNKHYDILPGEEPDDGEEADGQRDLELGEGIGSHRLDEQEVGSVPADANNQRQADAGATQSHTTNVTEELDNWDENEEDWDADAADNGETLKGDDVDEPKKRSD